MVNNEIFKLNDQIFQYNFMYANLLYFEKSYFIYFVKENKF
jgi:hypothetical protein